MKKEESYVDRLSEKDIDEWCKNIFDKVYISEQMICYSYESNISQDADYYFVDSQEKTVVKLDDPILINFANHVHAPRLYQRQIDWLLDFDKSGYYYFSSLDSLDKWYKEVEKMYDKCHGKISDDVLKHKKNIISQRIENSKQNKSTMKKYGLEENTDVGNDEDLGL